MVGDDSCLTSVLEVSIPRSERVLDSKQLLLMYGIVELSAAKLTAVVGNWVVLPVRSFLHKGATKCPLGGVSLHSVWLSFVHLSQHRLGYEGPFKGLEGILALCIPANRAILLLSKFLICLYEEVR